jgi:SAM-dependent methyltransferase
MDRPLFARIQARAGAVEERKGGADHRRRLLADLAGRVIEVGVGTGLNFAHYPPGVTHVLAVEPEPNLRARAVEAAQAAPVPVHVVAGVGERLPVGDSSIDGAVVAGVLCSVTDPPRNLAELARALRPGGELRFYEHVAANGAALSAVQRALDATFWPRFFGGCHTHRDTVAAIERGEFEITGCERFAFRPTLLAQPIAPRVVGRARRR